MKTELISISPSQASAWLASSNMLNRNIRQKVVDKYARDMTDGNWHTTHQGLAFYADGTLADGQHRLSAIIQSKKTVAMHVTSGMPRQNGIGIDQHAQRQMHDALRLGGSPEWVDKNVVAVCRFMLTGMGTATTLVTADMISTYADQHEEPIRFAISLCAGPHKGLKTAPMMGCIVCAYLAGETKEKLVRFAEIMATGIINGPHEISAIRLREYLLSNPNAWNGGVTRYGMTKRAQRALQAFCAGESLSKLYEPEKLIYSVPALLR